MSDTIVTEEVVAQQAKVLLDMAKAKATEGKPIPTTVFVACRVDPLTGGPIDVSRCMVPVYDRGDRMRMVWEARAVGVVGDALAAITVLSTAAIVRTREEGAPALDAFQTDPSTKEAIVVLIEWRHHQHAVADVVFVSRDQGFVDFDPCPASEIGTAEGLGFASLLVPDERLDDVPPHVVNAARPIAEKVARRAGEQHRDELRRMGGGGEVARG